MVRKYLPLNFAFFVTFVVRFPFILVAAPPRRNHDFFNPSGLNGAPLSMY
jgi:hypothetical protein